MESYQGAYPAAETDCFGDTALSSSGKWLRCSTNASDASFANLPKSRPVAISHSVCCLPALLLTQQLRQRDTWNPATVFLAVYRGPLWHNAWHKLRT